MIISIDGLWQNHETRTSDIETEMLHYVQHDMGKVEA